MPEWTDTVDCSCGNVIVYTESEEQEREDVDYEGRSFRYWIVICHACGEEVRTAS